MKLKSLLLASLILLQVLLSCGCIKKEHNMISFYTNNGTPTCNAMNHYKLLAQNGETLYYVSSDAQGPIIIAADQKNLNEKARFPMAWIESIAIWHNSLAVSGALREQEANRAVWIGKMPDKQKLDDPAYILLPTTLDMNAKIYACSITTLASKISREQKYTGLEHLYYFHLPASMLFTSENKGFEETCKLGILLYSLEANEIDQVFSNPDMRYTISDLDGSEWTLDQFGHLYIAKQTYYAEGDLRSTVKAGKAGYPVDGFKTIEWYIGDNMPYCFLFNGKLGHVSGNTNGDMIFTYDGSHIPIENDGSSVYGLLRVMPDVKEGMLYFVWRSQESGKLPTPINKPLFRLSTGPYTSEKVICFNMKNGKVAKTCSFRESGESVLYADDDMIVAYKAVDRCIWRYDWQGNGEAVSEPLKFTYFNSTVTFPTLRYAQLYAESCEGYLFIYDLYEDQYKYDVIESGSVFNLNTIIDLQG